MSEREKARKREREREREKKKKRERERERRERERERRATAKKSETIPSNDESHRIITLLLMSEICPLSPPFGD